MVLLLLLAGKLLGEKHGEFGVYLLDAFDGNKVVGGWGVHHGKLHLPGEVQIGKPAESGKTHHLSSFISISG